MRITKVSVKKLFGIFDHEIPLNQDSRITIIHGPNGIGKTVLLSLLYGLFHYDYNLLTVTPFEQFRVEFENGEFITVRRHRVKDDAGLTLFTDVLINYEDGTGKEYNPFRPFGKPGTSVYVPTSYMRMRDDLLPISGTSLEDLVKELHPGLTLVQMPYERHRFYWVSPVDEIIFTKEDILRKYPSIHNELYGEMPNWFATIQQTASPKFVSTSRLRRDVIGYEDVIMQYRDMQRKYKGEQQGGYAFVSSPDAVLDLSRDLALRLRKLEVKIEDFEKLKTEGFKGLNIIDIDDFTTKLAKLNIDIDDFTTKLAKLDMEIAEFEDALAKDVVANSSYVSSLLEEHRAEQIDERESLYLKLKRSIELKDFTLATILFLELINERFLFKSLVLRVDGLMHLGHLTFITDAGSDLVDKLKSLSGSELSSGEQHLLVLYYQLLFEVQPDTLVMIDEPELSMNVVWQRNFLKDLQRIIELRKFDVLIATHSPQIIHDKWDWMVALGESEGDS